MFSWKSDYKNILCSSENCLGTNDEPLSRPPGTNQNLAAEEICGETTSSKVVAWLPFPDQEINLFVTIAFHAYVPVLYQERSLVITNASKSKCLQYSLNWNMSGIWAPLLLLMSQNFIPVWLVDSESQACALAAKNNGKAIFRLNETATES